MLADARNRLDNETDKRHREALAAEAERRASQIEAAVSELIEAVGDVARVAGELELVLATNGLPYTFLEHPVHPIDTTRVIVATALHHAMPRIAQAHPSIAFQGATGEGPPHDPIAVARDRQVTPLLKLAGDIRQGTVAAQLPNWSEQRPQQSTAALQHCDAVA